MAIKEFIIGPQNYFEEGYFDGDYTLPNVSKAFLECDIDNIKGGRVVTGLYYLDNYIDGTYYHDNSIRSELTVEAMVVQEATVSLQGYIDDNYYQAGYYQTRGSIFTLVADIEKVGQTVEASGTISSQFTQSITVGRIQQAQSEVNASFTQTAFVEKLKEINLFAFSEAAIQVAIEVTRQANIDLATQFDIATDGRRFRDLDADSDSEFDFDLVNQRSREFNIETQTAFLLAIDNDRLRYYTSSQTASTALTCTISHIESADIVASNFATLSATIDDRLRDQSAALTSQFTATTVNSRIRFPQASLIANSFQTTDPRRVRFGVLNASLVSTLSAQVIYYKGVGKTTLSATFSLSATGFRADKDPPPVLTIQPYNLWHFDDFAVDGFGTNRSYDAYSASRSIAATKETSIVKFGSGALSSPTAVATGNVGQTLPTTISGTGNFTADFWYYYVDPTGTPANYGRIIAVPDSTITDVLYEIRTYAMNGAALLINGSTVYNFSLSDWQHLALQRNGTTLSLWRGGIQLTSHTVSQVAVGSSWGLDSVKNFSTNTWFSSRGFVDELRIRPIAGYTSTFTPPTAPYGLEYEVYTEKNGYALLEARSTLSAEVFNVQFASLTMFGQATLSAGVSRTRPFSSSLNSDFQRLFIVTKVVEGATSISAATTLTALNNLIRLGQSAMSANFAQSTSALRIRTSTAELSAVTATTIEATTVGSARTDLTVTATMSVQGDRIRFGQPQLDSIATTLAVVFRNATGTITLESNTALSADAVKTSDQPHQMSAQFGFDILYDRFREYTADANSLFDLTIVADRRKAAGSEMFVESNITINTDLSLTRTTSADLQANGAVLSATEDSLTRTSSADLTLSTQLICINDRFKLATATITSVASLQFITTKVVRITAVLVSQGFVLSDNDILNIDPFRQLKVAQETRFEPVSAENRMFSVDSETRVNNLI